MLVYNIWYDDVIRNSFKLYTPIAMLFVALLLFSNITAEKLVQFGAFVMPASILLYPLLYILGSIITEVYGKKHAMLITVTSIIINLLMALVFAITIYMPSATIYQHQQAYALVLGSTPRIVIASLISFAVGELLNISLTAMLKRQALLPLKVRILIANLSGLSIDCIIFVVIAFASLSLLKMFEVAGAYYLFKVLYQLILVTVIRYPINFLMKYEAEVD